MQREKKHWAPRKLLISHLVAIGNSGSDYPFNDVLKLLDDEYGYNGESSSHAGDPIEAMAFNQGGQLDKLAQCFEKVAAQGGLPKAVLVSGGGDDIAGDEFGMLLNNATSKIAGWNDAGCRRCDQPTHRQRVPDDARCDHRSEPALCWKDLTDLNSRLHYAVPDGRGFLGGWWILPGPWLQPGFTEKQFSDLAQNANMIQDIIDRFNTMLETLASKSVYSHVHYIDLRGTLSNSLVKNAYKTWWANELHPEPKGFVAVTSKFATVLAGL